MRLSELWLDPACTDAADLLQVLVPCPDDTISAYPVSSLVNNARNDGPELIEPAVRTGGVPLAAFPGSPSGNR